MQSADRKMFDFKGSHPILIFKKLIEFNKTACANYLIPIQVV